MGKIGQNTLVRDGGVRIGDPAGRIHSSSEMLPSAVGVECVDAVRLPGISARLGPSAASRAPDDRLRGGRILRRGGKRTSSWPSSGTGRRWTVQPM